MTIAEDMVVESQRERAKSQRRTRIVDAAVALLREHGVSDMTVVMIARRAEVDPATVYNLFGTKDAVIAQIFERDMAEFEKRVHAKRSINSLERLFHAVAVAADLYRNDPAFYRATMSVRAPIDDDQLDNVAQSPRNRFWQGCIQAVIDDGWIRRDADPDLIGVLLSQIAGGAMTQWINNLITASRFELEVQYGFAIVLAHVAEERAGARLARRLAALKRSLKAISRVAR